jgi:hypothetical protein
MAATLAASSRRGPGLRRLLDRSRAARRSRADRGSCATNVAAGSDVMNLLNDDPMSVLHVAGASSAITFRTTGRPIDVFALLGTLANENVTWRIRGGDRRERHRRADVRHGRHCSFA